MTLRTFSATSIHITKFQSNPSTQYRDIVSREIDLGPPFRRSAIIITLTLTLTLILTLGPPEWRETCVSGRTDKVTLPPVIGGEGMKLSELSVRWFNYWFTRTF